MHRQMGEQNYVLHRIRFWTANLTQHIRIKQSDVTQNVDPSKM